MPIAFKKEKSPPVVAGDWSKENGTDVGAIRLATCSVLLQSFPEYCSKAEKSGGNS